MYSVLLSLPLAAGAAEYMEKTPFQLSRAKTPAETAAASSPCIPQRLRQAAATAARPAGHFASLRLASWLLPKKRLSENSRFFLGQQFLEALVGSQPDRRDQHVQRAGDPRLHEGKRNRGDVDDHGDLSLEVLSQRLRQQGILAVHGEQDARQDVVGA